MADGYAITARLGLDTKGFKEGLASANQEALRHERSVNRASASHDRLFTSSHRVANRIHSLAADFASGANAADLMGNAIEGIGRSLNLPLGVLAGLAVAGVLAQQIYKSQQEVAKLHAQIAALGAGNVQAARFRTLESLKNQAEEAKKSLEALQKAHDSVIQQTIRFIGYGRGHGKEADEESGFAADKRELKQQLKRAQLGVAEKESQDVGIQHTKLTVGEHAAELEAAKKKLSESTGKAFEDFPNNKKAREQAFANANNQYYLDVQAADKKFEAAQRAIALEKQLIDIKRSGSQVDIRSAQAKLDAAHAEAHAARPEDIPSAEAKIRAAEAELDAAKKKSDADDRNVSLEERLTAIKKDGYDIDVRSAQAKFDYAKAALGAANADERGAAAAKLNVAALELESSLRAKYPSLGQAAQRQALAGEYQSLLNEQKKPVTNPEEARQFNARQQRISEIEQQLPAQPKTLAKDQDIQDQLDALNKKGGKFGEFLTPEEQAKKNDLEAQQYSRKAGARTPEEIAAQNEINAIDYAGRQTVSGLSPQQKARREELEQGLYGNNRAGEASASKFDAAVTKLDKAADKLEHAVTSE